MNGYRAIVRVACLWAAAAAVGNGQELIREYVGTRVGDQFGIEIAAGADLDGDGVSELLVSTLAADSSGNDVLSVRVISGDSGSELRTHVGFVQSFFGAASTFLGDVDGDGVADYVIDHTDVQTPMREAWVYSGFSGALLYVAPLQEAGGFLPNFAAHDDLNADGVPDFVAGDGAFQGGLVQAVSGADGSVLYTIPDPAIFFATDLTVIADQDADGVDDLAVVGSYLDEELWIYSAVDGSLIDSIDRPVFSVARQSDLDGDGVDELLLGLVGENGAASRLRHRRSLLRRRSLSDVHLPRGGNRELVRRTTGRCGRCERRRSGRCSDRRTGLRPRR